MTEHASTLVDDDVGRVEHVTDTGDKRGAAWRIGTSRRQVPKVRWLAGNTTQPTTLPFEWREGSHQRDRVGMLRVLVEFAGWRLFDQAPRVHDRNAIRH